MDLNEQVAVAVPFATEAGREASGADAVAELYRAHALGLGKLAYVVVGDREAADDIVRTRSPASSGAGVSSLIRTRRCLTCGPRC
jgi:hypothetical protein